MSRARGEEKADMAAAVPPLGLRLREMMTSSGFDGLRSVGDYPVSKWEIPLLSFFSEWVGNEKSGNSHFWVLLVAGETIGNRLGRSRHLVTVSRRVAAGARCALRRRVAS